MTDTDIHSCGYYCDRHACIVAQRNELRDKLLAKEWVGLTDDELHALHYELKCAAMGATSTLGMYRILEKALKEKNGG